MRADTHEDKGIQIQSIQKNFEMFVKQRFLSINKEISFQMLQLTYDELVQQKDRIATGARYTVMILWGLLFFSSVYMFVVLVFVRSRREIPYIAIPLCFAISGAIGVVIILNYLGDKSDDVAKAVALPYACLYTANTMGHQFFASLYLKAARSLALMFEVANLSRALENHNRAEMVNELERNGRNVANEEAARPTVLPAVVEGQIEKKIQAIEAISKQTHLLNFVVFIIMASLCSLVVVYWYQYIYLACVLILIFKNAILATSICRFLGLRTRACAHAIPNKNLIFLHFANMAMYILILFAVSTLNELHEHWKDDEEKKYQAIRTRISFLVIFAFMVVFQVYNAVFMFFLLGKQTNEKSKHFLAFLQNRTAFQRASEEQKHQERMDQELRVFYSILKEQLQEDLGGQHQSQNSQNEAEVEMDEIEIDDGEILQGDDQA